MLRVTFAPSTPYISTKMLSGMKKTKHNRSGWPDKFISSVMLLNTIFIIVNTLFVLRADKIGFMYFTASVILFVTMPIIVISLLRLIYVLIKIGYKDFELGNIQDLLFATLVITHVIFVAVTRSVG
jgi:hypothetical protein